MSSKHQPPTIHEDGIKGYETRDVRGKSLAFYFIALTVITIASAIVALVSWKVWQNQPSSGAVAVLPTAEDRTLPALPRLQPLPQLDIKALHASEQERLLEYKWIDKQAQIVQIPIDRASEIVAEKGLPPGIDAHAPGKAMIAPAQSAAAPAL